MTNLSKRIKKAKQLRFTPVKNQKGKFNTWGSRDDHYIVSLKSGEKEITTPDGYETIKVFYTKCEKQNYSPDLQRCWCDVCQGNTQHTVCYHSLGAIWYSFLQVDQFVSFYGTYRKADRALTFGGYLAKVVNQNGKGCTWAIVRKKGEHKQEERYIMELPKDKVKILDTIDLMRGDEKEQEGID